MIFKQHFIPGLAIYSYFIGDERTRRAVVIDPARDIDVFVDWAEREGLRITDILETHVHADFLSGARELKARLGGEPHVHASAMGGDAWTAVYADHAVKHGDVLDVGSLRFEAVHTPGHTPEHLSWALYDTTRSAEVPWLLLTGDFLFVGDVGRPDLLGEEARRALAVQLHRSVFETLPAYADFTEIFPAHGAGSLCGKAIGSRASTTLGYERRFNAALAEKPQTQWVQDLMAGMPPAPPYFARMKRLNQIGPDILGQGMDALNRISIDDDWAGAQILDLRSKEAFASGHMPGAYNVPMDHPLATWAGWLLDPEQSIVMVADDAAQAHAAAVALRRVGHDRLLGFAQEGFDGWAMKGRAVQRYEVMAPDDVSRRMGEGQLAGVVDVRTESEFESGHIPGALNIHAGHLADRIGEVPEGGPVGVACGSGYRAAVACSILQRHGREPVLVSGGMAAWQARELPVERAVAASV